MNRHLKLFIIRWLCLFCCLPLWAVAQTTVLTIEPIQPMVQVGQSIVLSVKGASGTIKWLTEQGHIDGQGTKVSYIAPNEPGIYAVVVLDGQQMAFSYITVVAAPLSADPFSPENAVWDIWTHHAQIKALSLSNDGKTLWVATPGGLEQREGYTGQLIRVLTKVDGLPTNDIKALATDNQGGLWIGTGDAGLLYRNAKSEGGRFTRQTEELPSDNITTLLYSPDESLWVGSTRGLSYRDPQGNWSTFIDIDITDQKTGEKSTVSLQIIQALLPDSQGGIWVSASTYVDIPGFRGLLHRQKNGEWIRVPILPDSEIENISTLVSDGKDGLWLGLASYYSQSGLFHLDATGNVSTIDTRALPDNRISQIIPGDDNSLWVGTLEGGLAERSATGQWTVFDEAGNGELPGRSIRVLLKDERNGLWIGTMQGLTYRDGQGQWQHMSTSELPSNEINAMTLDQEGGLWIGTTGGIVHRTYQGAWSTANHQNTILPNDDVRALLVDRDKGIWAGWLREGLAYQPSGGQWTVSTTEQGLPSQEILAIAQDDNGVLWLGSDIGLIRRGEEGQWLMQTNLANQTIFALTSDGSGGLWIGSNEGLHHLQADGQLISYTSRTSLLPSDAVHAVLNDGQGGVWVGCWHGQQGLAHLTADGQWHTYGSNNSDLPGNTVQALASDGQGGIWIGIWDDEGGLAHLSSKNQWQVFKTSNSTLPDNTINALLQDNQGHLWVGTRFGGLARLTFTQKTALTQQIPDAQALLTNKRAAILIQPRGQGRGYNQEAAVNFMASYAYHTLFARGYDNDEVYFLSYRPDLDFNADAQADYSIVDAPITLKEFLNGTTPRDLTVADVQTAFQWATMRGKLDSPLVVFFIDHGLPGELLLDPSGKEILTANQFKQFLDDYQKATQNPVIVVLEACYSGTLLPILSAPNRLIVSSTDDNLAYYDDLGHTSFIKQYLDNLRRGENFWQALQTVNQTILTYRRPLNQQRPQLQDGENLAKNHCLNGCFGGLPGVLTLEPQIPTQIVAANQPLDLAVNTNLDDGSVRSVWASVTTPEVAGQINEQGFSRLPTPVTYLRKGEGGRWQGRFNEFGTRGDYLFSFKARDKDGFIAESKPVSITVADGNPLEQASFNLQTNILHLPAVTIPSGDKETVYRADLRLTGSTTPWILELDASSLQPITASSSVSYANFDAASGLIYIPFLELTEANGTTTHFNATLQLLPHPSSIQFTVKAITAQ